MGRRNPVAHTLMAASPASPNLSRLSESIEAALRTTLQDRTQPLYRLMEYHMGWVDEHGLAQAPPASPRLHASWCLLTCSLLGGDVDRALPAATAVELVHHFSLIHDDIQNGNPERDRRPAVWWHWGPGQAINAGDGLHALARLALFRLSCAGASPDTVLEATRVLDQACLALCEGQYTDLVLQDRIDVTRAAYMRMAEARTGALLGCAAQLGALLAGASEETQAAAAAAGRKLGLALQVHREVGSLWGSAPAMQTPGDILNKSKTLPVVYALEQGDLRTKRELGTLYLKRVLEPTDVPGLLAILDGVGARESCEQLVRDTFDEALALLEQQGLSTSTLREAWAGLVHTFPV